jgi:NAD(P)-dependent dehydrogenase (short-subunit alcohol dehydrogenase family)
MASDDRSNPSRRTIVNGLSTGLVAGPSMLVSGQSLAQAAAPSGSSNLGGAAPNLVKPRTDYARPPFPRQEQPWPGLASRMDPRPDHGETSYKGTGRLTGRRALITGGDSGIGRAAAIAYAREGADVAINYLPVEEPDAKEVMDLIRAEGRKAVAIPGDIRDEAFCERLVEQAAHDLGGLDILVNNAARQTAQPSIAEITTDQFDATMRTNLYAMFWITKAAIPRLPAGASIINTASVVAYDPPKLLLDYSTTKAGIIAFTQALAKQLAEKGIRVNAVAPGPFWTPLQPSGGQPPDQIPSFGSDVPLGRPGQPVELAPVYVMLASDDSSYATGGVFGSTGGKPGP